MEMAAEPGDHEPRQTTELQQIFLRRDLDPGAAGRELEGHFGVGTGWLSHPGGQSVVHGEIAARGSGASAAHRDVPILGRPCPEAEETTETPMAPFQALSCCRTMFPGQPLPHSAELVALAPGAGRTRSSAPHSCQTGAGLLPCPSVL